jgi:hypothetical protein
MRFTIESASLKKPLILRRASPKWKKSELIYILIGKGM